MSDRADCTRSGCQGQGPAGHRPPVLCASCRRAGWWLTSGGEVRRDPTSDRTAADQREAFDAEPQEGQPTIFDEREEQTRD